MGMTPTVLIATTGIMGGGGFGINSTMTSAISTMTSNPLVSGYGSLNDPAILANVSGLSTTLSSIPSYISGAASTGANALTQAQNILPGAGTMMGNKNFLDAFNGASAFGSTTAEYSAALSKFGNKSFGDLGINMGNYTDVLSGGVTSLSKEFNAVANKAKNDTLGSLGNVVSPGDLATNGSSAFSNALSSGLKSIGSGLQSFGSLFNFSSPQTLGPANMIAQLQQQGLADRNGINEKIIAAGYNPNNLSSIPQPVLVNILNTVQGDDLQRVINQTGARPRTQPNSLGDLLMVSSFMPPQAMQMLGLSNLGGAALKGLGNTFTNLGASMDNFKTGDFMSKVEVKSLQYLESVKQLVPTSVSAALRPLLGTGMGPFGNPTMNDMIGTVGGAVHNTSFGNVNSALVASMNTPQGQALNTAMANMKIAADSGDPGAITAAKSALDSAVSTFNSTVAGNSSLSQLASLGNTGITNSAAQLAKEASNLSLAGVTLPTGGVPVSLGNSMAPFLSFGSRLHSLGVDKMQLGYSDMFNGLATNDLTGDALRGTLMEGRNLARIQSIGKSTSTVSNTSDEIAGASSSKLDSAIADYKSANSALQSSKSTYRSLLESTDKNDPAQFAKLNQALNDYNSKLDAWSSTNDKMMALADASGSIEDNLKVRDALQSSTG